MILVAGATGTTGGAVLRHLVAQGADVAALSRHAANEDALRAAGASEVRIADLSDPSTLPDAVKGVDAVYVATNSSPDIVAQETALARAAADAGVGHFVKLSVIGASTDASIVFGRDHAHSEQAIRETGIPFTFLRPNGFMQNTFAWKDQIPSGTIAGPNMDDAWSIIDVEDIAAAAAKVFESPSNHAGAVYTLTGPEPSTPREQIAIIGELLGRPLDVNALTPQQAIEMLKSFGLSEWYAERLGELFALYATGAAAGVADDFQKLVGRSPRTYRQFAEANITVFGAGS